MQMSNTMKVICASGHRRGRWILSVIGFAIIMPVMAAGLNLHRLQSWAGDQVPVTSWKLTFREFGPTSSKMIDDSTEEGRKLLMEIDAWRSKSPTTLSKDRYRPTGVILDSDDRRISFLGSKAYVSVREAGNTEWTTWIT